jgi:hypothetical protein
VAAEAWIPSRRIRAAATAERARMERSLHSLRDREQALAHELESCRAARSELERELQMLERLVGAAGPTDGESAGRHLHAVDPSAGSSGDVVLRGAQIRQEAVRTLRMSGDAEQAVHYRTWFDLLRARGFLPAGKDPLATFLTQIGRSPVVRRSTSPGMYSVDVAFSGRARQRLATLRSELAARDARRGDESLEELELSRLRRAELVAAIETAERELAEALRSLGD